jgi:phosphoribosylglycinamide formyltransferase-1
MADATTVKSVTSRFPSIGVLISGRGSNLQALIDAAAAGRLRARLRIVIANRTDAAGLERARAAGIETRVVAHGAYDSRAAFDAALVGVLKGCQVELVCLAGFMRLLGPVFCAAFPGRVLNIHPSLLPAFPGVDAQQQAFERGVKVSGATVHLVTPELDAGPIVAQAAVPVLEGDTVESLSARILEAEHEIYPRAVQRMLDGAWHLEGRRVVFAAGPGGSGMAHQEP